LATLNEIGSRIEKIAYRTTIDARPNPNHAPDVRGRFFKDRNAGASHPFQDNAIGWPKVEWAGRVRGPQSVLAERECGTRKRQLEGRFFSSAAGEELAVTLARHRSAYSSISRPTSAIAALVGGANRRSGVKHRSIRNPFHSAIA